MFADILEVERLIGNDFIEQRYTFSILSTDVLFNTTIAHYAKHRFLF